MSYQLPVTVTTSTDIALKIVMDHPKLVGNAQVCAALAQKPNTFKGVERKLLTRIIHSSEYFTLKHHIVDI